MVIAIEVVVKVEHVRKGKLIVDFIASHGKIVEVKPLQHDVEEPWEFDEFDPSLSSNLLGA